MSLFFKYYMPILSLWLTYNVTLVSWKTQCATLSFYLVLLNSKLEQKFCLDLMWTCFLDPACIVFENINNCNRVIVVDVNVSKMVMANLPDKSSLFNTGDSLTKLTVSDMVYGIFYCSVIKFRNENRIYITWFFEYGAFENGAFVTLFC